MQEALTNALKHAPGCPVAVALTVEPSSVALTIDSAGAPLRGKGMGLLSMSERAESVGGTCEAGPGGRGWFVSATIPQRREATA